MTGVTRTGVLDISHPKLIVKADTRPEAILRMRRALDEYVVEGVKTTIPLLRRVLRNSYYHANRG